MVRYFDLDNFYVLSLVDSTIICEGITTKGTLGCKYLRSKNEVRFDNDRDNSSQSVS